MLEVSKALTKLNRYVAVSNLPEATNSQARSAKKLAASFLEAKLASQLLINWSSSNLSFCGSALFPNNTWYLTGFWAQVRVDTNINNVITFTIFISQIYRFFLFPGAAVLYFEFLPGRLFRSGPLGPGLPAVFPFALGPVLTP